MTNARVSRVRRENETLKRQLAILGELARTGDAEEELSLHEQIQAEAMDLVAKLTEVPWMSHQKFQEVTRAIISEASGALDVLDAGGSLDEYREGEW